jgi:hypothetical protein
MLTHFPSTEKSVPETVTNGDDHLPLTLGDVRAETGERREKSQKAKAMRECMPVPVGDEALGRKGNLSPFSKLSGPVGPEPKSRRGHESVEGLMQGLMQ